MISIHRCILKPNTVRPRGLVGVKVLTSVLITHFVITSVRFVCVPGHVVYFLYKPIWCFMFCIIVRLYYFALF